MECKTKARFWIHYIFKVETTGFVTDQMGHVRKSGVRDGPRSLAWQSRSMGWSFTKVGKAERSNFGSPSLGQLSLKYPGDNQMEMSERLIGLELKRQNRAGNRQ